MHRDENFRDFIFSSKKYISFPEIIEFYTGIDRSRKDALEILTRDIAETCDTVTAKIRLPKEMNIHSMIQWMPTENEIENAQNELSENVINSGLPESIKDQHADRNYNQIKPYNQSIQQFFEEYSLHNLIQNVRASSRALRNSDYVDPEAKRQIFYEIRRSWEQISNVLLALTPVLAANGRADFLGHGFYLGHGFDVSYDERINRLLQINHRTIVGLFKDDLFSNKLGPLVFDQFANEDNPIRKHQLALLIILMRPREWKEHIESYIVSIQKNSFYLYDVVNVLRAKYRFEFLTPVEINEISFLIKMGYAKHEFGDKKPSLNKILKISNQALPNRENVES